MYVAIVCIILIIYLITSPDIEKFLVDKPSSANTMDDVEFYVINLKRRVDRKLKILESLAVFDKIPHVIEAIDGTKLDINWLTNTNKLDVSEKFRKLKRGEIGCYISHIKVWKEIIKTNTEYALILEDDAVFCSDFRNKLTSILKEVKNTKWDMLFLTKNCLYHNHLTDACNTGTQHTENTHRPFVLGYGLYGYLVRLEAIKKLIVPSLPIKYPIDVVIEKLHMEGKIDIIRTNEELISYNDLKDSETWKD